eukprot:gene6274-7817_t
MLSSSTTSNRQPRGRKAKLFQSSKQFKSTTLFDYFDHNSGGDDSTNINHNEDTSINNYNNNNNYQNSNVDDLQILDQDTMEYVSPLGKRLKKLEYSNKNDDNGFKRQKRTDQSHQHQQQQQQIQSIDDGIIDLNTSAESIDDKDYSFDNNNKTTPISPSSTNHGGFTSSLSLMNQSKLLQKQQPIFSQTTNTPTNSTRISNQTLSLKLPKTTTTTTSISTTSTQSQSNFSSRKAAAPSISAFSNVNSQKPTIGSLISPSTTTTTTPQNNFNNNFSSISSSSSSSPSSSFTGTKNYASRNRAPRVTENTNHPRPISMEEINISPTLSDEQRNVLKLAMEGNNIFFTGSAGTGKSFLLKEMVRVLKLMYPDQVHVTASTGIAACNIGGVTVHSFAGIGIGDEPPSFHIRKIMANNKALTRWTTTKVLIIDEVSMISKQLFDRLEEVARGVRKNQKPFGGVQLILSGDFCQLPPVSKNKVITEDDEEDSIYCFRSLYWNDIINHSIQLRKVFRQKDTSFINILNQLRFGTVTDETLNILNRCKDNVLSCEDGIIPTVLYPLRRDVESENSEKLENLKGEKIIFDAIDEGTDYYKSFLEKNSNAPSSLSLKIGAQVILIKNLDFENELVNGSRGVVIGWTDNPNQDEALPIVRFSSGLVRTIGRESWNIEEGNVKKASRRQIPLNLAWSLSIHKGQGMTIDRLIVDLNDIFAHGQTYVALSRATSLEGLVIKGTLKRENILVHKDKINCLSFIPMSFLTIPEIDHFLSLKDDPKYDQFFKIMLKIYSSTCSRFKEFYHGTSQSFINGMEKLDYYI